MTLYYADIRLQQPGNVGFQRASLDLVGWLRGPCALGLISPSLCMFPLGKQSTPTPDSCMLYLSIITPPSFMTLCVEVKWMVGRNPGSKQGIFSICPKRDTYFPELEHTKKPFSVLTLVKNEILINPIPYFNTGNYLTVFQSKLSLK